MRSAHLGAERRDPDRSDERYPGFAGIWGVFV
jgi:hypothetical protein